MRPVRLPIVLFVVAVAILAASQAGDADDPAFTQDGRLQLPADYRSWIYLSSGLGMSYNAPGQGMQMDPMFTNVFVKPAAYREFVKTGKWPDKTMFVLEERKSATNT